MRSKKIQILCHPARNDKCQIGGWKINNNNSTIVVTYLNTTINIDFESRQINVTAFSENGDVMKELGSAKFPYSEHKNKKERHRLENHMVVKDFFCELVDQATLKDCKLLVTGVKNEQNNKQHKK